MFIKVFNKLAIVFVFAIAIILGIQLKGLVDQIGTKDSISFLNLHTTINDSQLEPAMLKSIKKVAINNSEVKVDAVTDEKTRKQGLMHKASLAADRGMLFVFERMGTYPFWMKDTLIPLDIIWMNTNREIVHIKKNVPPCTSDPCTTYIPTEQAIYVLEVNAGWVDKHAVEQGQKALFFN